MKVNKCNLNRVRKSSELLSVEGMSQPSTSTSFIHKAAESIHHFQDIRWGRRQFPIIIIEIKRQRNSNMCNVF